MDFFFAPTQPIQFKTQHLEAFCETDPNIALHIRNCRPGWLSQCEFIAYYSTIFPRKFGGKHFSPRYASRGNLRFVV